MTRPNYGKGTAICSCQSAERVKKRVVVEGRELNSMLGHISPGLFAVSSEAEPSPGDIGKKRGRILEV